MALSVLDSRSTSQDRYRLLRAAFDAAYKSMTDSSKEFNAVLISVPLGLSQEAKQARKESAAQAYEDAHERFMAAVQKLNEFMIGQIISSRAALQPPAAAIERKPAAMQALTQTDSHPRWGRR